MDSGNKRGIDEPILVSCPLSPVPFKSRDSGLLFQTLPGFYPSGWNADGSLRPTYPATTRQITHTKPGAHTKPNTTMQPVVVRLYTRLYSAFFGLVSQPAPLGALKPRLCRMYRLADKRADKRFLRLGMRKPNFMVWVVGWVKRWGLI